MRSELNISQIKGLMLFGYRLPISYATTTAILFRKLNDDVNTSTHSFVMFYDSYMFQIFLPFNSKDIRHYKKMTLPLMPPLFDGSGDEKWKHLYQISLEMSSSEPKNDDVEVLSIQVSEDAIRELKAIDPTTKKAVEGGYNPNNITGFYFVDPNFIINLKDE